MLRKTTIVSKHLYTIIRFIICVICFGLVCFGAAGIYADYKLTDNILGNVVGGNCGPCMTLFGVSCGTGPKPTACSYNWDEGECSPASCPSYCPKGGNNAYCLGLIGDCNKGQGPCSLMVVQECKGFYSGGTYCKCTTIPPTDQWCQTRTVCN
jgi:hypothetical protein